MHFINIALPKERHIVYRLAPLSPPFTVTLIIDFTVSNNSHI